MTGSRRSVSQAGSSACDIGRKILLRRDFCVKSGQERDVHRPSRAGLPYRSRPSPSPLAIRWPISGHISVKLLDAMKIHMYAISALSPFGILDVSDANIIANTWDFCLRIPQLTREVSLLRLAKPAKISCRHNDRASQ